MNVSAHTTVRADAASTADALDRHFQVYTERYQNGQSPLTWDASRRVATFTLNPADPNLATGRGTLRLVPAPRGTRVEIEAEYHNLGRLATVSPAATQLILRALTIRLGRTLTAMADPQAHQRSQASALGGAAAALVVGGVAVAVSRHLGGRAGAGPQLG